MPPRITSGTIAHVCHYCKREFDSQIGLNKHWLLFTTHFMGGGSKSMPEFSKKETLPSYNSVWNRSHRTNSPPSYNSIYNSRSSYPYRPNMAHKTTYHLKLNKKKGKKVIKSKYFPDGII